MDENRAKNLNDVPAAIRDAGEKATRAYLAFFAEKHIKPHTRSVYGNEVCRFFRWAEERRFSLDVLRREHVTEYLQAFSSKTRRSQAACALRGLFRQLAEAQVVAGNLLPDGRGERRRHRRRREFEKVVCSVVAEKGTPEFQAGMVLLAGLLLENRELEPIAHFTNVALAKVEEFAARLRAAGIWTPEGYTACCWG